MKEAPIIIQQIDNAIEVLQVEVDEAIDDLQQRIKNHSDILAVEKRIDAVDEGITLAKQLIDKLLAEMN